MSAEYSLVENEQVSGDKLESNKDISSSENKFIESMELNGPIDSMLQEAIRDPQLEFEFIYGDPYYPDNKPLTKERFLKLKNQLTSDTRYKNLE